MSNPSELTGSPMTDGLLTSINTQITVGVASTRGCLIYLMTDIRTLLSTPVNDYLNVVQFVGVLSIFYLKICLLGCKALFSK